MINLEREYYFEHLQKKLLIKEWGPVDKPVVLLIHGFPGCAEQAKLMSDSPFWNSFRLIALDRPGYGKSDPQNKITPLQFANQIQELVKFNRINELSIISVSGGAPYAMATAYLLKEKVKKLTSLGGLAPLNIRNFKYMNSQQKKVWLFQNIMPKAIVDNVAHKTWKNNFNDLDHYFFNKVDSFPGPDQVALSHPLLGPQIRESMKMAVANGPHGILHDMRVYSRRWGFPLGEIRCPVTLWHGGADDIVHHKFAEDMKNKLPNAKLRFIENEGHYSLLMNHRDEILKDLLILK
jgi:pimeloyl-ACP methyl ester carboxylesterase